VKIVSSAFAGLVSIIALAQPAAAQDLTTAAKVECVPVSVTRCTEPGKCTTRQATDRDKSDVLVIDFTAKKASMRRGTETRQGGDVVEDKVVDGVRRVVMTAGSRGDKINITLTKEGKLAIDRGGGNTADATCTAAAS